MAYWNSRLSTFKFLKQSSIVCTTIGCEVNCAVVSCLKHAGMVLYGVNTVDLFISTKICQNPSR